MRVNAPASVVARGTFFPDLLSARRPSRRVGLCTLSGSKTRESRCAVSTDPGARLTCPGPRFLLHHLAIAREDRFRSRATQLLQQQPHRWEGFPRGLSTSPVPPFPTPSSPSHDHRGLGLLGVFHSGLGLPPLAVAQLLPFGSPLSSQRSDSNRVPSTTDLLRAGALQTPAAGEPASETPFLPSALGPARGLPQFGRLAPQPVHRDSHL